MAILSMDEPVQVLESFTRDDAITISQLGNTVIIPKSHISGLIDILNIWTEPKTIYSVSELDASIRDAINRANPDIPLEDKVKVAINTLNGMIPYTD